MAGPKSIQKVPAGLLSLLDMKGIGTNPVNLNDGVAPVIDVTEAYCEPLQVRIATAVITGPGQEVDLVVPAFERWRVLAFGIGCADTGAPAAAQLTGIIRMPSNVGATGSDCFVIPTTAFSFDAGVTEGCGGWLGHPVWLGPGAILRCRVSNTTIATVMTARSTALVQVLQV